jgi:glycosyltransferase involved in cell wall biosynthesis
MTAKRPKIAFVTPIDARSRNAWSGTYFSIWNALQKHVGDVELIGPVKPFFALWFGKMLTGLSQKIFHKRFDYPHSKMLARAYGSIVSKQLRKGNYDLVVTSSAFIPYLKTSAKIAYISDTTVMNSINYYKSLTDLFLFSKRESIEIERMALEKADFLIYPSLWASNSAIHDFNIPAEKVFTFPYGANIETVPEREQILSRKKNNVCHLLFLGVDWNRKGGEIAFDALIELNRMGIDTQLTVCGCIPPEKFQHPKLKVIPFLDKKDNVQKQKFINLFFHSDFLILPTRNECFGVVFCEASAFGVPSITADTGGVSSAVTQGENGFLLPDSAGGKEYAQVIASIFKDDYNYYSLVKKSRELYESKLNWDKWGEEFKKAYERILSIPKKGSV